MAQQHFYSRVPARVSMYNKYDSFDTFAHSAELTREFVERDLAIVYNDKLSKNDISAVRNGEISPVYYQCLVRSGNLVQGCLTFLPLDYTKERSAYLTHTLVFSEDEQKQHLYSSENSIFNAEMYKNDISDFDITNPNATSDNNYPTVEYVYKPLKEVRGSLKKYDPELVKNFIGALLLALCKKGKNVYFKLEVKDKDLSLAAMKVISEVISILPYNLRSAVSFISYLNDPTKYPNFKLKSLASKVPEVALEKGVFVDFKTGLITGLNHEDIVANKTVISFFYSLLENNKIRVEFLDYIDRIVENIPGAKSLNIKTLSDLVFLFCHTSGFFAEEQVLPGDVQVYEMLCIYDKYREALTDEYRNRVYKCLNRYVEEHRAIPKDIFSKVTRLYHDEINKAKRIVMGIALQLIHTDIMREKLFQFISSNYESEDDDIKAVINTDLCRVFYGGFMQMNILKFFNANFDTEPLDTQNKIIEKLLLSIRTVNIQNMVLEFFDNHYASLSKEHIEAFYDTFFEMLVVCDGLSDSLVKLVNKHIESETPEFKESVRERLSKVLEADYRHKEHLLIPILMKQEGFCIDSLVPLIFGEWSNRKVFVEYLEILKSKPIIEKTIMLINDLALVEDMTEVVKGKLVDALDDIYLNSEVRYNLYEWLETDKIVKESLKEKERFVLRSLLDNVILKGIASRLKDVFRLKFGTNGLNIILEYAKENSKLVAMPEYKLVSNYVYLIQYIKNNEIIKAFSIYDELPVDLKIRSYLADHINHHIDRNTQEPIETIYYDLLIQLLKTNELVLDKVYIQYKDTFKRKYLADNGAKANLKKAQSESVVRSFKLLYDACYSMSSASPVINALICRNESKLRSCILDFMNNYGGSSKKWLSNLGAGTTEFAEYFRNTLDDTKVQGGSFFGKIFGKK